MVCVRSFGRVLGGFWAKVLGESFGRKFWAKVFGESFGPKFWAKVLSEFSFLLSDFLFLLLDWGWGWSRGWAAEAGARPRAGGRGPGAGGWRRLLAARAGALWIGMPLWMNLLKLRLA